MEEKTMDNAVKLAEVDQRARSNTRRIEKLEEVQTAYRTVLAEKQPGGWDALCAAAKGWKQPVLRGKKYEALRDAFPDIRKSFEKSRDEAKKIFTDARDRYLAAALRHIVTHRQGARLDDESGMPHLAHAIASLLFIMALEHDDD